MIVILNDRDEVAAMGHKTPKEAHAWVRWALTVRPGVKYHVLGGSDEEIAKVVAESAARRAGRESMTITESDVGDIESVL